MFINEIDPYCLKWLPKLFPEATPYYGLRDYKGDKAFEIGSEKTPQEYIARLVDVFREMRRVLRPDGLLWHAMRQGIAPKRGKPIA